MKITVEKAAELLLKGSVVAIPTETVFGLGASIYSQEGIKKIFELKNRPLSNPLIIHISSIDQIQPFIEKEAIEEAICLFKNFWPGPLTIVLPLKKAHSLSSFITAQLPTVAIRMPKQKETLQLIDKVGPIVAPSANRSGYPSSTQSSHVENDFGKDFFILEGTTYCVGLESTIIAKEDGVWKIAREGAITPSDLQPSLGYLPFSLTKKEKPICPGQHFKHYSPLAQLILKSYEELQSLDAIIIGYENRHYPKAKKVIFLGPLTDPLTIQKNLYSTFRFLDETQILKAYIDIDLPEEERLQIVKRRIEKAASQC